MIGGAEERERVKVVQWAKYYPPECGGMERVTHDLATGFAANGKISVVVAFTRVSARSWETIDGVCVYRHVLNLRFGTQPISFGWIVNAVRQSRTADAIIAHAPNLLILFPMLILWVSGLWRRKRPRRILFWHSDIIGKGLLGSIAWPIELMLAAMSDVIIATSVPYARFSPTLSRFSRKTAVVPLGIEPVADRIGEGDPILPETLAKFVGRRPLALAVGRLVGYKGFQVLLDAFIRLPPTMALVIVGEGPLQEQLEKIIAKNGAGDRILLAGAVDDNALAALYRRSDCFVMSSLQRSEAFGMVLLEAMACAKPLIVCDIEGSGVAWVAGDEGTAIILPVNEPAEMARAISALLLDCNLAERMGASSQRRFERNFTKAQMVRAVTLVLTPNDASG